MHQYRFKRSLLFKVKGNPKYDYVDYKFFQRLVSEEGFPKEYHYGFILCHCPKFEFYSKTKLQVVYVKGYPLDVEFFDVIKI